MCGTKAPGPNGFLAVFYQKHWKMVKAGVVATCLHILNEQGTITPLNYTYIALISKIMKPRKVTDFRPISLCNVIYRIVAIAIANRLKHILHQVISLTQNTFIPNKLLTDSISVGYECLHKIKHSKGKINGLVALKLDISKAYDRVEWMFLKQTMLKLGFAQSWLDLIMWCITIAFFSVIINGTTKGLIYPQRGLRQGRPPPLICSLCVRRYSLLCCNEQKEND